MPDSESILSFWSLIALLALLLLAGRLVAGLTWWAVRRAAPWAHRLSTRAAESLAGRRHLVDAVVTRFPSASRWTADRFSTDHFTGLPLTLIVVLAGYLASLASDLAEDVIERAEIVKFDEKINTALAPLRDADLLHVFARITQLAEVMTLLAVMLVAAAFLWVDRRRRFIPGLMLAVLGSQTLTYIGKYAINRPRPDFLTFASASSPSFPSGHSAGAMAVYGFIAYALARNLDSTALRFELGYWCAALIATIAFSRLLLSVHFTSDVAAGLLVGAFWLLAGFALTEYLNERAARR